VPDIAGDEHAVGRGEGDGEKGFVVRIGEGGAWLAAGVCHAKSKRAMISAWTGREKRKRGRARARLQNRGE